MQPVNFDMLIRYFAGDATPDEALYVEGWRNAEETHAVFFDELFAGWNEDMPYRKPDVMQLWQDFQSRMTTKSMAFPARKKHSMIWRGAAAVLFLLVGAAYFVFFFNKNEMLTFAALDHAKSITLPDSTRVTLQPGAELSYTENTKTGRRISLKGDAIFEIVNHQSPLVADLEKGLHILDIGTRFSISQKDQQSQITVYSGKIAAFFHADTVFAAAQQVITTDAAARAFHIETLKGSFEFKDVPVGNIVRQLSDHFHISIIIKDQTLSGQQITITTGAETLDVWLEILSAQLGINYYQDEKGNFIME